MARNVISVPGNHDFFKSSDHFQHTVNKGAKVIKLDGVRFGLLTGIPTMIGEWVDEIMDFEFKERIRKIPWNIQVLLTHAGPYGVLDNAPFDGLYDHLGFQSYQQAVFGLRMAKIEPKFKRLKAILFGHCHEANAIQDTDVDGRRLVISNAACGIRSIELKIP
jgi:Icc-related predicted phosphoesterase